MASKARRDPSMMASGDDRDEMKEPEWMVKKREYEQRMARAKNAKLRTLCTICSAKAKLPCPCGTAQYCTVACQRIDWRDRGHRTACKKIRDDRAAEAARMEAPTPPKEVVYGPAPRSHADEVRARIAAEHEAARVRREANPEPEPESARFGSRCPVCFEDWDVNAGNVLRTCCCRKICRSCTVKVGIGPCPLCRVPHPKDDAEQLAQLRRHVENEVPEAIARLGRAYCNGDFGLVKSSKKAARLYKRAVELESMDATMRLGHMYEHGYGVEQDAKKADELYRVAADRGVALAQNGYMKFLENNGRKEEAFRYNMMAAQQGHAESEHLMGLRYWLGLGTERSSQESTRWHVRAAAKGYKDAIDSMKEKEHQYTWATQLHDENDHVGAFRQFKLSADQGFALAVFAVGTYYEEGLGGVDLDIDEAKRWYARSDTEAAKSALAALEDKGKSKVSLRRRRRRRAAQAAKRGGAA